MSAVGLTTQQLHQDLQNELTTANQLLRLISNELQKIKFLTNSGGEFEANVKQNASLVSTLANLQQIDLNNLLPVPRKQVDLANYRNKDVSEMDDT